MAQPPRKGGRNAALGPIILRSRTRGTAAAPARGPGLPARPVAARLLARGRAGPRLCRTRPAAVLRDGGRLPPGRAVRDARRAGAAPAGDRVARPGASGPRKHRTDDGLPRAAVRRDGQASRPARACHAVGGAGPLLRPAVQHPARRRHGGPAGRRRPCRGPASGAPARPSVGGAAGGPSANRDRGSDQRGGHADPCDLLDRLLPGGAHARAHRACAARCGADGGRRGQPERPRRRARLCPRHEPQPRRPGRRPGASGDRPRHRPVHGLVPAADPHRGRCHRRVRGPLALAASRARTAPPAGFSARHRAGGPLRTAGRGHALSGAHRPAPLGPCRSLRPPASR